MTRLPNQFANRRWKWGIAAVVLVAFLIAFPPFRILRLGPDGKPAQAVNAAVTFNAVEYAARFWSEELQPAAREAPELAPILSALRADPLAAARQHGRKVGEGSTWYYFARGSGRVAALESSRLLVEIDGAPGAVIAIRTGPVFGNAVRDASGLIELNSVPGLSEFNALSAELNRLVEETVQPKLKSGVMVGDRLSFTGAAEAPDAVRDGPLLVFVPVLVETIP